MAKETLSRDTLSRKTHSIAGTNMVYVKIWHITVFIFLFSFLTLFTFFYVFQPTTLLGTRDWLFYSGSGGVRKTNNNSENNSEPKWLSDRGRVTIFAWAIGLGAAIALFFHFIMIFT
jgi:hypothetical protein